MKKEICVVTSGRADYGYLLPVINKIRKSDKLSVSVIAPDNHPNVKDLEYSNVDLYVPREIIGIESYSNFYTDCLQLFKNFKPDVVMVLGDRFETMAAATAALLLNIPIAHIAGGETTEGSFDNQIRHAITQMATYHFTSNEEHERKVCNMLPSWSNYVYNVGSPTVDNILWTELLNREDSLKSFDLDPSKPFVLASYHPTTKEPQQALYQITNLLNSIYRWGEQVIFVNPNIDPENEIIKYQIDRMVKTSFNKFVVSDNIPRQTFLSLMSHAEMLIGNSSAGIIEAAYLRLPVVNVGNRQSGRLAPNNVVTCGNSEEEIFQSMLVANKMEGNITMERLYGDGTASKQIVERLERNLCK